MWSTPVLSRWFHLWRALLLVAIPLADGAVAAAPPYRAVSSPAVLAVPGGQLHGTLTAPGALDCPPLVLMLAGSGPTDRDGNSALLPGRSDSLKQLAHALAQQGIASLRYDKRGVATGRPAAPDESRLRPSTHAADAAAWLRQLRAQQRYASVTVLGHSEGSLIGMLAARDGGADAFVSVAGPAQRASQLLRRQWLPGLAPDLAHATTAMLASLERGRARPPARPELQAVFRPSVQPYMMAWFRYVPADEFASLQLPALIVHGTRDTQVDVGQAALLKRARPDAEVALVAGMNHMLKVAPAGKEQQLDSYVNPAWPLAPSLVQAVAGFVHTAPRRHACQLSGGRLFAAAPG